MKSRDQAALDAPILSRRTNRARSTSAFKVSIYHLDRANVSGFSEFRVSPARATTKAPLPRGQRRNHSEGFYANGGIHNPLPIQTWKHHFVPFGFMCVKRPDPPRAGTCHNATAGSRRNQL